MTSTLPRWLGALLGAVLLAYVTWLLTAFALSLIWPIPLDGTSSGPGQLLARVISHAASGGVFVYVTTRLAPPHPRRPALAFLALVFTISALVAAGVLAFPTGMSWVEMGAMLVGAGVTATLLSLRVIGRDSR